MTMGPADAAPPPLTAQLLLYWRLTRPGFMSVTLVGCLVGIAAAAASGIEVQPFAALATVVLALAAHAGANVLNDHADQECDAVNTERVAPFTGGSRLIQEGAVGARDVQQYAWLLLGLTLLAGIGLAARSGGGLILIGAAGLFVGWAYSAPPLSLMRRGLGEPAVAAGWWLVVVGADYVQRRDFSIVPMVSAPGYALLVAAVLFINCFPDRRADAATGKRTLLVRLGPAAGRWAYLGLVLGAHVWLVMAVALEGMPATTLLALLSLPLSAAATLKLWRHAEEPARLRPAIVLTIAAALLHGLGLTAGFLWAAWGR